MAIEWYPGHMEKALKQIGEMIRSVDVVIEVLDARLPDSSSNHLLEKIRQNKPCIKVLNKNDLADPKVTKAWVRHLESEAGVRALPLSAKHPREVNQLPKLCLSLAPNRGTLIKPLRAMIVGIPNAGKSTLINTLVGKSIAKVGDKPAITVTTQQIELRSGFILHDTPGVLWPHMKNQFAAYRLATSGAIGSGALDYAGVGLFAAELMMKRYPEPLKERYHLSGVTEPADVLEAIGRRLGCVVSGGAIDLNRAGEAFLRELRAGKIGRISFEEPGDDAAAREARSEEEAGGSGGEH